MKKPEAANRIVYVKTGVRHFDCYNLEVWDTTVSSEWLTRGEVLFMLKLTDTREVDCFNVWLKSCVTTVPSES